MIGIDRFPDCGFGNKLIYYYNLRNEALKRGCRYFCVPWQGHELFEGDLLGEYPAAQGTYDKFRFCLGERFFERALLSSREVFRLKCEPDVPPNTCAVHFRGTDFGSWNPGAILDVQYYIDGIRSVSSDIDHFFLFTDDVSLASYKESVAFVEGQQKNIYFGENSSDRGRYGHDFSVMACCDYIISSPSTYSICAGFIGKKKRIIHSSEWVRGRVAVGDKFWVDLIKGGNDDYSIWKLV